MTDSIADSIARLQERYRPHAVSPVTVRRKPTDSPPPAGTGERMPDRAASTMANRAMGARYPGTYKPRAEDFAGMLPATTRPAYGSVTPASHRRIGLGGAEQARADGENQSRSEWVAAREGVALAAGEVLPVGAHYPRYITRKGNLGPQARY